MEPITRHEIFLAKSSGDYSGDLPEPITREEMYLKAIADGGGGGGTSDYTQLENKPQINSVELSGNKSLSDIGAQAALTFDDAPTENSTNPVTSGGLYTVIGNINTVLEGVL